MAHFFTLRIPSLFESSWCSTRFIGWQMWRAIKSVGRSDDDHLQDWGSMVMNVDTSWLHPSLFIAWFMQSGIDEFVPSLTSYVQLPMNVPFFRFPAIYPFGMWLQMLSDLAIRDVREWLSTFPFPPIPIDSIPIPSHPHSHFLTYSHSHGIPVWDIPISSHSHSVNAKVVYN